jgi:uncharacterized protein (TIGR03437 family)
LCPCVLTQRGLAGTYLRMRFSVFLLALAASCALLAQTPSITALQNNYSYTIPGSPNYGIAPGSLFIVTGANLSNATNGLQTFPLPTSLGGVSISVTVAGVTTQPPIYYAYPTQLGAVLPSTTPVGTGTLTVTNNGKSTNTQIQVVQSAFGILTVNNQGSGRAAAFDLNNNLLTSTNAVNPGGYVTLWGSGVGADPLNTNETIYPQKQDNLTSIPMVVDIGGVAGNVVYRGRSQYPGVDQIDVQIPQGVPTGCYVSVVVSSGSIVSNSATIPVAASGATCSDSITGYALSYQETIGSNSSVPLVMSLGAAEQQALSRTVPTNVGTLLFEQDNQPNVTNILGFAVPTENVAEADFLRYSPGDFIASFSPFLISMGSCMVSPAINPQPAGLDAGAVTVSGGGKTSSLNLEGPGQFLAGVPVASSYTFAGSGGNDVGAFSASVTVPSPALVWNQMNSLTSVVRSQGVTVTWTGGAPNTAVVISGQSAASLGAFDITRSFFCMAPVSAGKFTVPASVLLSLPTTPAGSQSYLGISNSTNPITFSASGIDLGFAAAMIFDNSGLGTGFIFQ